MLKTTYEDNRYSQGPWHKQERLQGFPEALWMEGRIRHRSRGDSLERTLSICGINQIWEDKVRNITQTAQQDNNQFPRRMIRNDANYENEWVALLFSFFFFLVNGLLFSFPNLLFFFFWSAPSEAPTPKGSWVHLIQRQVSWPSVLTKGVQIKDGLGWVRPGLNLTRFYDRANSLNPNSIR